MAEAEAARRVQRLIELFDGCFFASHRTRLVWGGDEPLYRPATGSGDCHRIEFAHGHFRSALHEIAHWCIAGPARRQLADYGYWYSPDGRSAAQQRAFERVEARPQALEWIFCAAAGTVFRVSVDNLAAAAADSTAFRDAVHCEVRRYCRGGLPARAQRFRHAMAEAFGGATRLRAEDFERAALDRSASEEALA